VDNSTPPRPGPNVLSAPAATVASENAREERDVCSDEKTETRAEGLFEIISNVVPCDEPFKVPQDAAQEAVPNEASPDSVSIPTVKLEKEGEDDSQSDKPSGSVHGAAASETALPKAAIVESVVDDDDDEDAPLHSSPEIHDKIPLTSNVLDSEAIPESLEVVESASDENLVSSDAADQCTERQDTVTADYPDSNGTTSVGSSDGNEVEDMRGTNSNEAAPCEIGEATTSPEIVPASSESSNPSAEAHAVRDNSSIVVLVQSSLAPSDAGVEPDTAPTRPIVVGERNVTGTPSSAHNAAVIATEVHVVEPPTIENDAQDDETAKPASAPECEEQILEDNERQPSAECELPKVDSAKSVAAATEVAEVVEPNAVEPETASQIGEKKDDPGVEEETQPTEAFVEDESVPVQDGWASHTPDETMVEEDMPVAFEERTLVPDVIDGARADSGDATQTIVIEEEPIQSVGAAPEADVINVIAATSEEVAEAKITEEKPNRPEGTMSVSDSINMILKGSVGEEPITELQNVTSMTRVMIPDEKRNSKPSVVDRWGLSTTMSKVKTKALLTLQGTTDDGAVATASPPKQASGSDKPATWSDKPTTAKTGWSSPKSVERVLISLSEELAPPSPPSSTSPKSKTGATKVARSSSGRSSEGRPISSSSRASSASTAPVSKELTEIEKARLFAASVLAETEKRGAGDSGGSDTAGQPRSSWWKQKVVASLQHEL
jgi:hypothetical protein